MLLKQRCFGTGVEAKEIDGVVWLSSNDRMFDGRSTPRGNAKVTVVRLKLTLTLGITIFFRETSIISSLHFQAFYAHIRSRIAFIYSID